MTTAAAQEREITVERLEVLRSGTNARTGRPWTLFKVIARDEQGQPIADELCSFDPLTGTERVTFEPYERDGALEHYTLRRVRDRAADVSTRRSAARAAIVGETNGAPRSERIEAIEARLSAIEAAQVQLDGRLQLILDLINANRGE